MRGRRLLRRGWPIRGYVGPNGSGKTAAAVFDVLPSLEAGRPVLSTVRLLDYENPRACEGYRVDGGQIVACEICVSTAELGEEYAHRQAHPLWVPFREWSQLLEAERCDVLMDEVTGVASSRESHSMPSVVANALVQMRRADVTILWTAPSWARADKIIRECSQAVTYCEGYCPKQSEDSGRVWRNRRLSRWRTYDAQLFEDFTAGKRQQLRAMCQEWRWLPSSGVFDAYDSFDAVLSIGTVTEGGTCERCGGRRSRPVCRCHASTDSEGRGGGSPAQQGPAAPPRGRRAKQGAPV